MKVAEDGYGGLFTPVIADPGRMCLAISPTTAALAFTISTGPAPSCAAVGEVKTIFFNDAIGHSAVLYVTAGGSPVGG